MWSLSVIKKMNQEADRKHQEQKKITTLRYYIIDWAGNTMFNGEEFDSFDNAEEFLSEFLDDKYTTDRQEYYINEIEKDIK